MQLFFFFSKCKLDTPMLCIHSENPIKAYSILKEKESMYLSNYPIRIRKEQILYSTDKKGFKGLSKNLHYQAHGHNQVTFWLE